MLVSGFLRAVRCCWTSGGAPEPPVKLLPPLDWLSHLHTPRGRGTRVQVSRLGGLRHLALGGTHSSMLPPVVGWKTLGDHSLWDPVLLAAIASEMFNVCLGVNFSVWFSSGSSL